MSTPTARLLKAFNAEVPQAFGFLADRGFETVAQESGRCAWTSAELGVEVALDAHEMRVATTLDAFRDGRHIRASLVCVYVKTGCGAAQDVHERALSSHSLSRAVASQAQALTAALAAIHEAGLEVIVPCHGR